MSAPGIVKVYLGGLPPSADDSTVAELLSAYGRVESVSLKRDPVTLQCQGYGFAKLHSEADAAKAIAAIHNNVTLDREQHPEIGPIQVRIVRDESSGSSSYSGNAGSATSGTDSNGALKPIKLFIGGVPGTATGKALRVLFQPYGEIVDLFISPEKGYGFVKFSSHAEALAAMANVNGVTLPNAVRPLEVRIAQSTKGLDGEELEGQLSAVSKTSSKDTGSADDWIEYFTPEGTAYYYNRRSKVTQWEKPAVLGAGNTSGGGVIGISGPQEVKQVHHNSGSTARPSSDDSGIPIGLDKGPPGANIFVYGLPDRWKEKEFMDEFARFGQIHSIKVIYDRATALSKGYGFISYTTKEAAEEAVDTLHGTMLGGRKLKVQIKRGEESGPY